MFGSKWLSLNGWIIFLFLLIIDIMCVASALRILFALCWFEHLILIKICLIDIGFLLDECGIHCFNTVDYCLLKYVLGNVL